MTPDSEVLLRPKASVAVETDMASFEGALNERWCHLKEHPCGAPRHSDSRSHKGWANERVGFTANGRCAGCGLMACPDCVTIWRGRNG